MYSKFDCSWNVFYMFASFDKDVTFLKTLLSKGSRSGNKNNHKHVALYFAPAFYRNCLLRLKGVSLHLRLEFDAFFLLSLLIVYFLTLF